MSREALKARIVADQVVRIACHAGLAYLIWLVDSALSEAHYTQHEFGDPGFL